MGGEKFFYGYAYLAAVFKIVTGEAYRRPRVVGQTGGETVGHSLAHFFGSLSGHKRTARAVFNKTPRHAFCRRVEKEGQSALKHVVHVAVEAGCPASAGYNGVLEFSGLAQHRALDAAELLFPFLGEDARYGSVESLLDIEVEVDKLLSDGLRESLPESCLSAGHVTDYEYGPSHGVCLFCHDISESVRPTGFQIKLRAMVHPVRRTTAETIAAGELRRA